MKKITIHPLRESIDSSINIPSSKSYTIRALLLATLTKKPVVILNPLISDDTKAMIFCLKSLGIKIVEEEDSVEVVGDIRDVKEGSYNLNASLSGITLKFILALSIIVPGVKKIYGLEGLNKRPIGDEVDALRELGAKIDYLGEKGFPPVSVVSADLGKKEISINGSLSSQYLSSLLMIAPIAGIEKINVKNEQVSKSYVDMTIDILNQFGIEVLNNNYREYLILGNEYDANSYLVETDLSSASYFFAIAALTKSKITVKNVNPKSVQADINFLKILEKMGQEINFGEQEITIVGKGISPININMNNCPDQAQTLSVLAAFAKGDTKITGIKTLRHKETERVKAVEEELAKMGIKTNTTEDSIIIHGGVPKSAAIDTYGDHRMAMSFAVAGTKIDGITINNPEVVSKSFPDFWKKLKEIGIKIEEEEI